jgi:hypothetical protein
LQHQRHAQNTPAHVDFRYLLRDALVEADPDCFNHSNEE